MKAPVGRLIVTIVEPDALSFAMIELTGAERRATSDERARRTRSASSTSGLEGTYERVAAVVEDRVAVGGEDELHREIEQRLQGTARDLAPLVTAVPRREAEPA